MTSHGKFVWNELVTPDQKRCGAFYCGLIGWTKKEVDAGPMGTYTLFQQDGQDVAGMMGPTGLIDEPRWSTYIAVDDVYECASKVGGSGRKGSVSAT